MVDVFIIDNTIGHNFSEALLWNLGLVVDISEVKSWFGLSDTKEYIEDPGFPPCGIPGLL